MQIIRARICGMWAIQRPCGERAASPPLKHAANEGPRCRRKALYRSGKTYSITVDHLVVTVAGPDNTYNIRFSSLQSLWRTRPWWMYHFPKCLHVKVTACVNFTQAVTWYQVYVAPSGTTTNKTRSLELVRNFDWQLLWRKLEWMLKCSANNSRVNDRLPWWQRSCVSRRVISLSLFQLRQCQKKKKLVGSFFIFENKISSAMA